MILVVDNYDSFVYTLVAYLRRLGAAVEVRRNDEIPESVARFTGVLISPGPGKPEDAGGSIELIRDCERLRLPLLGVCLGHQALAAAFGARVSHAPELRHGKTSDVWHTGGGVFAGLPQPMTATRYHSLAVERETVPPELVVTAWTGAEDRPGGGVIMGLQHASAPLHGVQFHPESVMTEGGYLLLANWLALTGEVDARSLAATLRP